jgi:hypothetical protein
MLALEGRFVGCLVNNKTPSPLLFSQVFILKRFKFFRMNTCISVDSKEVAGAIRRQLQGPTEGAGQNFTKKQYTTIDCIGQGLISRGRWGSFRVTRNPSRVSAKRGDHFLQADLPGLGYGHPVYC